MDEVGQEHRANGPGKDISTTGLLTNCCSTTLFTIDPATSHNSQGQNIGRKPQSLDDNLRITLISTKERGGEGRRANREREGVKGEVLTEKRGERRGGEGR